MSHPIILLVGHGSRRDEAITQFVEFATGLSRRLQQPVRHCFLELADPDVAAGLSDAARQAGPGGTVVVVPVFLGSAGHEKNDVAAAIRWGRAQFPGVEFRYGAPLGPHAALVELLDIRVRQAVEADAGALPPQDTCVLVVGRGSSDPDSNSELARIAHLLFEKRPFRSVEYAFQAVARPTIAEGLERCRQLGARQVVVAPYVLFTGRVYEDIARVAQRAGSELGLRVLAAQYLGNHPLLLDVAAQRLQEAVDGTATVTCDLCKYRLPMAGYEGETSQPQTSAHLHGGSAGREGAVYLVGAGPGDPALLTLRAQELIAGADVILYAGSLVNPAVLAHARPDAAVYDSAGMKLGEQIALMRTAVERGKRVVRLHTGDPSIYGAILEQMRELDQLGIACQVVPGVSSAFAAAAALGIELTVPEVTQTVILTRLGGQTPVPEREELRRLAAHRTSLVVFLSVGMLDRVVEELRAAGYADDTPIAVVSRASWPDEQVVRGCLADIAQRVLAAEITHQALIVVSPALSAGTGPAASSHLYSTALDAPPRRPGAAIVTLTRQGTRTGARLLRQLPDAVLYLPARFAGELDGDQAGERVPYTTSVRQALQAAFRQHTALVCIMASGIAVRELAPLLKSKHADPGVVVVDEQGRFAISLLAGHKGGANRLAEQVAGLLGGQAVLTTASDGQGLPALDLLGREQGWRVQRARCMAGLSAALVNGDPVGVVQDAGDAGWWSDPAPANLSRHEALAQLVQAAPRAALIITCRRVPPEVFQAVPCSVVYNPPCLAVGVGCNRGTPAREILEAIEGTLDAAGLEPRSICRVATVVDKAGEAGLIEACAARGWPLKTFSHEEIAARSDLPNPSPWAQRALGVPGVAEPTALLAAGARRLLVEKRKFPNVTVAVALVE